MIAIKRKYSSFERARRMFAHNRLFMEYTFYTIESRFISRFWCVCCVFCVGIALNSLVNSRKIACGVRRYVESQAVEFVAMNRCEKCGRTKFEQRSRTIK